MRNIIIVAVLFFCPVISSAQIAEGVAAGVALEQLENKASGLLREAVDAGDYLATKAAIEALNVIDRAEAAYEKQLGATVEEIDGLLRRLNDIDAMLDDADSKLTRQLEDVGRLETRIAQIVSDTLPGQSGPYISYVRPTIVAPKSSGSHRFVLRGVDLYRIEVGSSEKVIRGVKVSQINKQEYLLEIPSAEFSHSDDSIEIHSFPLKLVGNRQFFIGPRKSRKTTFTVGTLSNLLATFKYNGSFEKIEQERRVVEKSPGQMRGSNTTKYTWAKPTFGWKVDITQPIYIWGTGGNQGRCEGHVENELSPNGIKLKARLDRIGRSTKYPNGAPGRISCHARFTEYRENSVREEFSGSGSLSWNKDEDVTLPHKNADVTFEITVFDGSVIKTTGSRESNFFEIQRDNQFITLKPTPPHEL